MRRQNTFAADFPQFRQAPSERRTMPLSGLYAITPEDADTARLIRKVAACLEGGASAVQYRNKQAPTELAHFQALQLHTLCQRFRVPLIINDSLKLACAVNAEGIHLGRDDGAIADARRKLPNRIIGVSCYNDFRLAQRAMDQGADYVAFGSFFSSSTKPEAVSAGIDLLASARQHGLNTVAIGGITAANAGTLIAGGAHAVAVISALFESDDEIRIRASAEAFTRLFHHV
jgi:thiamine-phosphate pyrophosphorylase